MPFLQWTLKKFQIVPILFGRVDPDAVALALDKQLDDKSLIVVSTDLSHYHPYDEARSLDAWCIKAVQDMDVATMAKQQACALPAVLTLDLEIAKEHGWKPHVLDYRTSGDASPKADKDKVVGYMAVVFTEGGDEKEVPLTGPEKEFLLKLARATVTAVVQGKGLPTVDLASLSPNLRTPKGASSPSRKTTSSAGLGYTMGVKPLYLTVMETAANAAVRDQRFKPVAADELGKIVLEISVLSLPKSIYYNAPPDLLTALRPKVDGVVLEVPVVTQGRRPSPQAVYLPPCGGDSRAREVHGPVVQRRPAWSPMPGGSPRPGF